MKQPVISNPTDILMIILWRLLFPPEEKDSTVVRNLWINTFKKVEIRWQMFNYSLAGFGFGYSSIPVFFLFIFKKKNER